MNTKTTIFYFFLFFLPFHSTSILACDDSSASLISYTDNGDGTYTTILEVCNEFNGLEGPPDEFTMTFEGITSIDSFSPATVTTTSNDDYDGNISGNVLMYSTSEIFPGNSSAMFCNTYTIITSEPLTKVKVATNTNRNEVDCLNRVVCIVNTVPTLTDTTIQDDSGILDLTILQDPDFSTGTWSGTNVSGTDFDPTGLDGSYELTFISDEECTDTSRVTVQVNTITLAIELSRFEAKTNEDCDVTLLWTTTSERQSAYFELEQSQDGLNFNTLTQITTKGNSQNIENYQTDIPAKNLANGTYFRLKEIETTGNFTYSDILKVDSRTCTEEILITAIYPNPAQESTILDLNVKTAGKADILIYDVLGKLVQLENIELIEGNNVATLDLNNLLSGVYFVEVRNKDSFSSFKQLVKE